MKKQIVTACALIASVAAFATSVESSNTFGVLKIAAPKGQSIIPVPWEKVGGGDIVVTDYVLPTGLTDGDLLYWYDANAGAYKVWKIASGAWAVDTTIKVDADSISTETSNLTDTVARGTAAILNLSEPEYVYLSGQYADSTVTTTIYGLASGEHEKYPLKFKSTLIAAPQAEDYSLKNMTVTGTVTGDKIMVASSPAVTYVYGTVGGTTGWYKPGLDASSCKFDVKIPSGVGAWYMRYNDGNITITW